MLTNLGLQLAADTLFNGGDVYLLLCNGTWTPGSPNVSQVIASEQIAARPLLGYSSAYNSTTNRLNLTFTGSASPNRAALINRIAFIKGGASYGRLAVDSITNVGAVLTPGQTHSFTTGDIVCFANGNSSVITSVAGDVLDWSPSVDTAGMTSLSNGNGTVIAAFAPTIPGQLIAGSTVPINLTAAEYGIFT